MGRLTRRGSLGDRVRRNVREGRLQRSFALVAGVSAVPLAIEIYLEHYKASFGDPWEWAPIAAAPPMLAAGIAGYRSERAARTVLPAVSAVYALNGLVGSYLHLRGVHRKPGGFREPTYNFVMGPPALAPGSLALVGALGVLAAGMRRER